MISLFDVPFGFPVTCSTGSSSSSLVFPFADFDSYLFCVFMSRVLCICPFYTNRLLHIYYSEIWQRQQQQQQHQQKGREEPKKKKKKKLSVCSPWENDENAVFGEFMDYFVSALLCIFYTNYSVLVVVLSSLSRSHSFVPPTLHLLLIHVWSCALSLRLKH